MTGPPLRLAKEGLELGLNLNSVESPFRGCYVINQSISRLNFCSAANVLQCRNSAYKHVQQQTATKI